MALAGDREERSRRLTAAQANLLKVTRLLPRLEIRGGAGSGKTVLAMQQAGDLASGRLLGQKKRVAVVCYSYGLATYLRRSLLVGSASKRPSFVGTFEDLGRRWGITDFGSRDDSTFWEVDLPRRMGEVASGLAHDQKFDAVIVDEAQDFADDWWTPLLRSLRDEETGGLYAYSDERQRVFARFGRPPVQLIPLVLDHNLRKHPPDRPDVRPVGADRHGAPRRRRPAGHVRARQQGPGADRRRPAGGRPVRRGLGRR